MASKGPDAGAPTRDERAGGGSATDTAVDPLGHEASGSKNREVAPGALLATGRFEIGRRIGRGGMGVVYEVFDTKRREKLALKTMTRLEARDVYQLKNEFRALADVSHPNLVRLHELFADSGLWCFTMEFVAGEPFDRWVRPRTSPDDPGELDEERLRHALPQLFQALAAVHSAGKLHRDLKPSNVLVTREGRVVVLDFGLAIDGEEGGVGHTLSDEGMSGTPAYMAPEQAMRRPATSASDFYALGVMVFEVLTGRLPFEGKPHELLFAKDREVAPLASELVHGVAPDLDELCAGLLAREPSARPQAARLIASFPPLTGAPVSRADTRLSPRTSPELLGRESELVALREAYEATLSGQSVVLLVGGESGMGKSSVCGAFLHELRTAGRTTVLRGRCYERENVPFKGFDSLVDDLSRHLRRLAPEEAAALLPREVYALTRLFPVLGRVDVVAAAPTRDVADPLELRQRASAAFAELLRRMRDRGPLCLFIDDAQWLDSDAVSFLRALLVQPEPVLGLLVLSHRSEPGGEGPALSRVRDAIDGNRHLQKRTLSLGPLAEDAARALAFSQLPSGLEMAEATAAIVGRESGGSPFFVGELCRFVARHGTKEGAVERLSLKAALVDHLVVLSPAARRLLELCALAGKPLPTDLLLQAASATHAELDQLRSERLLGLSRMDGNPIVECYHDKVRETVADALSETDRTGRFEELARTLQAHSHADAELLATCFEGTGQRAAAAEYCVTAAEQAMAGTAFLHAAELYRRALRLGAFSAERAHQLRLAHGTALARGGRGKEAAESYLLAAKDVEGIEKRELRRLAAMELFSTGHWEEGMALFQQLFRELGLTLPASNGAALRSLLFLQLRKRFRGLGYVPREAAECSPEALQALTVQYSALPGLAMHASPLVTACVADDFLLRALDTGEPMRVASALASGAYFLSAAEPSAAERILRMRDTATQIINERGEPWKRGSMELCAGQIDVNRGLWLRGREHLSRALELLPHRVEGDRWELDSAFFFDQVAAFFCGDWLHVARTTPSQIEQGYSRDRIWLGVMLSGYSGCVAWLSRDDVAGYQRALAQAKQSWPRGNQAQWPDYYLTLAEAVLHLYRRAPRDAVETIERLWKWFAGSLLGRAPASNAPLLYFRGTALLASSSAGGESQLSAVKDCVKRLGRCDMPYVPAFRDVLHAGVALQAGDRELGKKHLHTAVAGFDDNDMRMFAAAARRRLGELIGGDEGRALLSQGDDAMRGQRIVDLDAVTEMLCAGCRAP